MMKLFVHLSLLSLFGLLSACGEGRVMVTNESYEPRIVIEGYLFPGQRVREIRISRNFRLDVDLSSSLIIENTRAKITDESDGREYVLTARPETFFNGVRFDYEGDDWLVEYGRTYTIDVGATVDGRDLQARATTTVPRQGFKIDSVNHERLTYRQRDERDELINFELAIERSPQTTFYVRTVRPLSSDLDLFIYDNPFGDWDREDVEEDLDDFDYSWNWLQNTPKMPGISKIEIFWFDLWFYGSYEVIVYAADKNFIDFLRTYDDSQAEDGNFNEPAFNIEGDGIGVFGSAIADTVRIVVLRE